MQEEAAFAKMQGYIANIAITPSALRNLGARGLVGRAQGFLTSIDLKPLKTINPSDYQSWLNGQTDKLVTIFGIGALWGPARKSINIFMVMAALNRFLCAAYSLDRLEDVLEVPLDNRVAVKVLDWAKSKEPVWTTIKNLDKQQSEKIQSLAAEMAKEQGIPRGQLDVILWSKGHDQDD
jgi:hypothetical protein